MTRRHLMTLRLLLVAADGLSAVLVFLGVSVLRFEADPLAVWSVGIDRIPAALLFAGTWILACLALGLYRLRVRWGLLAEARDIGQATLFAAVVTLSLLFLLHQDDVSRVFLLLLFTLQPIVMLGGRTLLRRWFEARRRGGRDISYMLIVGTGPLAQTFADRIEDHPALGMRIVGHVALSSEVRADATTTRPIVGLVEDLPSIFRTQVIDELAVCLSPNEGHYLDPVVALAAEEGKTVRVPRDPDEGILAGGLREDFAGYLVTSIIHDGQREIQRALKRVVDVAGAALAMVVLSPLLIAVCTAILLSDGTPVLFRQTRIGRHGRPFTIYKFRTMARDAEARYAEVAALSDTRGAAFKMTNDPRVTRIGRTLRKWTLDELPQLLNVIKGDMSLVGPRPAPPREVDAYDLWHRRRLSVRPGMTGLWQVEARFDEHFDDRAALDLRYIDQWSLWMDAAILLRTLPAVLMPRGH